MSNCNDYQEVLVIDGYEFLATSYINGQCRHIWVNKNLRANDKPNAVKTYGVSDNFGYIYGLTKQNAENIFSGSFPINIMPIADKPKSDLENIEVTLTELEKNLKIILKRSLVYVGDFFLKQGDKF